MTPPAGAGPLLRVTGLVKHFALRGDRWLGRGAGAVRAVDGIDFTIAAGESLGLVGESGCGKSTTGRLVARLLEPDAGAIFYQGRDIAHASRRALAPVRPEIQMIFQDPYSSLNPRHTIGETIAGPLEVSRAGTARERRLRARELLELVGLNPEHYHRYPHEFSGGQRQRVGVARALAPQPRLIVADEPVSALDVSIQAQVLNLLRRLQRELGIAFLLISHDLAVVRHVAHRVAVMYLGKVVETAPRDTLFATPRHPYTHALLSAVPDVDARAGGGSGRRIRLAGDVPSPIAPPSGCRFRTRCWKAKAICAEQEPPLAPGSGTPPGHRVACHFPEEAPPAQPSTTTATIREGP